jgi:alanine racemase
MPVTPVSSRPSSPTPMSEASSASQATAEPATRGPTPATSASGMPAATPLQRSAAVAEPRRRVSAQNLPSLDDSEGTVLTGVSAMERKAAGAIATVDVGAVRLNFREGMAQLGERVTPAAVIKADAYGLGAVKMTEVLIEEGCKDFFVARISEAADLRQALRAKNHPMADKIAINALDGHLDCVDPQFLIDHQITPVLNSLPQLREWNDAGEARGMKLPAFLQFDTGLNRSGATERELNTLLANRDNLLSHIDVQFIMTQLAKPDEESASSAAAPDPTAAHAQEQLSRFNAICANFPGVKATIGASSAVFLGEEFHKDMVRLGSTFHGQAPFGADTNPLRPALTLKSKIAQTRDLTENDAIGYGLKFEATEPMKIATIPIGYADGVPRIDAGNRPGEAPTKAYVLIGGFQAPLVGATSMDMTTVDVSAVPPEFLELLKPGTEVTLMGEGITPDHFGKMYDTDASETQTKLTRRVYKEYLEDPSVAAPTREAQDRSPSANAWPAAARPAAVSAAEQVSPPAGPAWAGSLRHTQAVPNLRKQVLAKEQNHRLRRDAAGVVATINLGAVRTNFRTGKAKLGADVTPAAVVKANAYGLGAVKMTEVLIEEGCKDFFVARIIEATDLRKALRAKGNPMADKVAINVLDGLLAGADPQFLIDHQITPVLNSLSQLHEWNEAGKARGMKLPAFLQFDTGMNRAGATDEELKALLADRDNLLSHTDVQCIMTHLAKVGEVTPRADGTLEPGDATRQQLARFNQICDHFPGVQASIGASTTVFLDKDFHKDMVRMGATFHGQAPFEADANPLEQAMTLKSHIKEVRTVPQGEAIGHGRAFIATEDMRVATLPLGYGDGLPRITAGNRPGDEPSKAYVLINGEHKAPLVGTTSMDEIMVDVSKVPADLTIRGTTVTLIGDGVTPDHFGNMYNTNPSEAQTKLTNRVFREYVEDPAVRAPRPDDQDRTPSPRAWKVAPHRPG